MKKKLVILSFMLMFITTLSAQNQPATPLVISAHGGYSWLDGVVGVDFQSGIFGLSGGWMPTTMPISGEKINSYGIAATIYSGPPTESSIFYLTAGVASDGYQYETSSGYGETQPVTIVLIGTKYNFEPLYLKAGVGYGWCDKAGVFAFELTLGLNLFKNYNK